MNVNNLIRGLSSLKRSRIVRNSIWGLAGKGGQTLLLSLFFIILARKYDPSVFALFLIANSVYLFLSTFSTLGLGQWFTRTIVDTEDKVILVSQFLKIQFLSSIFFYALNAGISYLLYDDPTIRMLAVILGINILFDNIIYGIQALNVADFQQKKSFIILFIDAALKFLASCLLFVFVIPIETLAIMLIGVRFLTLNIFLRFGSSSVVSVRRLISYPVTWEQAKNIIIPNWAFVIIGSVSIVYWRIGNLIISKTLPLEDVANYEVSYKVFSLLLTIPVILSTTVFPSLVEKFKVEQLELFKKYFHRLFIIYFIYSLMVYTFFYSFSDYIIPLIFGNSFAQTGFFTKGMFLAILVFPTALLQANVLIAMKKEKTDMWLNVLSLGINVLICMIGLFYYKSLTIVNIAIFVSFLIFHILQDIILIRNKISTIVQVLAAYILIALITVSYTTLSKRFEPIWFFLLYWIVVISILLFFLERIYIFRDYKKLKYISR